MADFKLAEVHAILILTRDGSRFVANYYNDSKVLTKDRKRFERHLHQKAESMSSLQMNVFVYRENLVLTKTYPDFRVYLVIDVDENELLLGKVLTCMCQSFENAFKTPVTLDKMFQNYDVVLRIIDEVADSGMIMDVDSASVTEREAKKDASDDGAGEHSLSSALALASDQIIKSLRS